MASHRDARRIALSLPGASEAEGGMIFRVENAGKQRNFAWTWRERLKAGKPRVPRPDILAVRVRDLSEKATLLGGDPDRFFTEPHYDGFPAVLVRLPAVSLAELRALLKDAWRCQAPTGPVKRRPSGSPPVRRGPRR